MLQAIWWGGLAAASLLIGYGLARRGLAPRTVGMVMGFGAGALISAIAYELIPESMLLSERWVLSFTLGALAFFLGDWLVDQRGGAHRKAIGSGRAGESGAAIFLGTLLDNVPESTVLGMTFAFGGSVNIAFLVAVFVSNLPEGLAGSINLEAAGYSRRRIFWLWVAQVLVAAACAGLGYLMIRQTPAADGHLVQAFAAGAMLTMLADAMMPEAFEHGGNLVGLCTVLGFVMAAALAVLQVA